MNMAKPSKLSGHHETLQQCPENAREETVGRSDRLELKTFRQYFQIPPFNSSALKLEDNKETQRMQMKEIVEKYIREKGNGKRREEALTSLNSGIVPGIAWHEWNPYREEKAQRQHAARQEHTASGNTRHAEAKRSEREGAEGGRRHSRSSGHPATGFSGRSDPFSTPPHQQVETRRTGGQAGRDLEAETGRTGGRGGRLPSQPTREETGRIGGLGGRYSIPPPLAQAVTGRTGGCEGQDLLLGALPLTPGPEFE
ncbi:unnamed protein product [Sphagnum compactum]